MQVLLDEAQEAAFRAGDGLVELEALAVAHQNAFQGEDLERALPITERWLQRANALGDRDAEAYARVRLGVTLLALRQDLRRVVDILASLGATYEELGSRHWIAKVSNTEAVIAQELGDLTRAADCYLRAYGHFEAVANRSGAVGVLSCHGVMRARAGDLARGRRDAVAALDRVREGRYDLLPKPACSKTSPSRTPFAGTLQKRSVSDAKRSPCTSGSRPRGGGCGYSATSRYGAHGAATLLVRANISTRCLPASSR